MIIACPACSTRYVVPDNAIGVDGRTVRCAKCKHSWFQDGADVADIQASEAASPPPPPPPPPPPAPRQVEEAEAEAKPGFTFNDDVAGAPIADDDGDDAPDFDETPPPSYDREGATAPPVYADDDEDDFVSRFDHSPPFRPRRNMMKLWTWAAAIFAVLALGVVIAITQFGTPSWWPVDKPTFGQAQPDLELRFPPEAQSWRELENKTYLFSARIEVENTSRESRKLPPIQIVMLNEREDQVFTWIVQPPQPTLAPGETVTIDEASTQVPRNAVYADVGWAPL
ncbi:zinc-ribbon domain-containing protein [Qipengyuania sp. GH38]|uniref:zinc-ribbon domain-containing protein n=1 Tax=Qipengyuania intermedia TaxID=2867244 RepID=UPI001C88BE60|nr:zinc-ribbon domain-containing protein [Qipengyuania intermedia]MBX7514115.1 zinc-ribbon domain-containing protein [Qipengyuania intermedia]